MDLLVRSWIIRAVGFLLKFEKIVPIQMMTYYLKSVRSALMKRTWGSREGGKEEERVIYTLSLLYCSDFYLLNVFRK